MEAAAVERGEALGFRSREAEEPPKRILRKRADLLADQRSFFVKGPGRVIERFIKYTNAGGFRSYWEAINALLDQVEAPQ